MKAADTSPVRPKSQRFRSLRSKVFLPYFLLISALFIAVLLGAFSLADLSFKNSVDQRLQATQETLFREFKKQESLLQIYANTIQQFQSLSERYQDEAEIGILQDRLYNTLEEYDINTAIYPADIRGLVQQESLVALFDQVRRSDQPRFRYSNEFGGTQVLMVAAPLHERGEISKIILLQTAMGDAFLRNVTSSLNVDASLMTLDGQVLARSSNTITEMNLTPEQINLVGSGQTLYLDYDTERGSERHVFSIIPLGSSDMVLLSLEAPLEELSALQYSAILHMILVMLAIAFLGSIFFFRRVSDLTLPVKDLRAAADALCKGNLNYRIFDVGNDELGQIAVSFNHMAAELEKSYQDRVHLDISAALTHAADKTKLLLEKKRRDHDKLTEELNTIQRETSALYQLNHAMTASIELGSLFDRILQVLNEVLACDYVVLLVHNLGESALEVVRTAGLDAEALNKVRFTFNQGVTGEAAQSQRMIYVKDINLDNRSLSYHGQVATRGSMISVPLVVKGRLVGAINLHKKQTDAFPVSAQKLVQAIANQTAIAIDNAQLLVRSRDLSNTDELTGLANRRHFQEVLKREVSQARRFSSNFSIVMGDIDNFKKHKSTVGNIQADALLRKVGQFLLKNTRGIDLVCRFGNDQFIILLPKTNRKGALAAAEKLRKRILEEDFASVIDAEQKLAVTLSFGVTEFPIDSKNIYELLNLADRALYAAKKAGSNCTVVWEGVAPAPE
jgi:diguanylate cyclase (GGDEF)-like protein